MMNRVNAACQSLAETKKNLLDRLGRQQEVQTTTNKRPIGPTSSNKVIIIGEPVDTLEVIVKTGRRKSQCPTMVGRQGALAASKSIEDGRSNDRGKSLRDQNRPVMKQCVQQLAAHAQSPKHTRQENVERKETRKAGESRKPQKYGRSNDGIFCPKGSREKNVWKDGVAENKILDEIAVKRSATKKMSDEIKSAPNSAVPSTTTIASSMESIEVKDRQVQCGGIFDRTNDRFGEFNPIKTIGFLMKEMENLVRDERSSKILTDMQQAILRISIESERSAPMLDAATAKLAESSAKIESMCAAQREEIESLSQQVNIQAVMLKDAKQRERNLENEVKQMKLELNDALKSAADSRRTILELEKKSENAKIMEKLVTDLRRELNEQIELAEHRFIEGQYSLLEKEKLMTLSSYKDSQLIELRRALKELQNHIAEQRIDIREAGKRAKETANDNEASIIKGGGAASSSLNSSCSINSIVPGSCPELSEISISTVDCLTNSAIPEKKSSYANGMLLDDSEPAGTRLDDKTQLEFISLPGGEVSHAISLSQRKDEELSKVVASSHSKKEETRGNERRVEGFHSVPNIGRSNPRDSARRVDRDNRDSRSKSKTRKFSNPDKRRSIDVKSSSNRGQQQQQQQQEEEDKRPDVDRASGDPASIKKQFEIMFDDIRKQGKLPVHVPSPPRHYPHPEWSDTSLPTISDISESNIV